jgi:OOP family OmpA-OmpF porin
MGGRLSYETNSWIGFEAAAGTTPTAEDIATGAREFDFFHASGNFVISPARHRWGTPYAFVGGGYTQLKPAAGAKEQTGGIEFGGGLKMWMTDGIGLRFEARDISFKPLETTGGQNNFHNVVLGAGLTFAIGATPRDTDGDGVPDKKDKCPDTPRGATVGATGCPSDSDGDGVLDGLDMCQGTPRGATVDAKGCPSDADGDGVFNGVDKCPDTPKGATVDAFGCPSDSDGDGVLDGLDQCPNTPAELKVDAHGCPIEVSEKETELLDTGTIRLQNINFDVNKATIKAESDSVLTELAKILLQYPLLTIEIGGHTDASGKKDKNMKLSEARAQSVLAWLTEHYPTLDATKYTVKGYGPTVPVASNNTALGRAKNRRVEFKVTNTDELKIEREKRGFLKKDGAPADSTKR